MHEGFGLGYDKEGQNENVIIFLHNKQEFEEQFDGLLKVLKYDTVFWVAYPKGTSKLASDVNRDILFNLTYPKGVRVVSNVAIDDTWSALRIRPIEMVK